MDAARERDTRRERRARSAASGATSSAVYSGSTSRVEFVNAIVALLAASRNARATPRLRRAAAPAPPARARASVRSRVDVMSSSASAGRRCAPAARRRSRTASPRPPPAAGSCVVEPGAIVASSATAADAPASSTTSTTRSRSRRAPARAQLAAAAQDSESAGRARRRARRSPRASTATVRSTGGVQRVLVLSRCLARRRAGFSRVALRDRGRRRDARGTFCTVAPLRMPSISSISLRSRSAPGRSALFTDEDVGDLHQSGLERLDRVARFRHEDHDGSCPPCARCPARSARRRPSR